MTTPDELRKLADELEKTKGDRHLVVLDRGWIFVGNLIKNEGEPYILTNAKNVRKWEIGGFGALSQSAKKAKAVLDNCADIYFSESAKIFCVPISENWDE